MALRRIGQHFDFICRSLTLDDTAEARAALRQRVRYGRLNWRQVISLAGAHFVLPALWTAYSRKSMTGDLPSEIQDYLADLHWRNIRRNDAILEQTEEAVATLNAAEVAPVLLKGAIHLFEPNFGDPGARMMRDLDILVPGVELDRAVAALQRLGYQPEPNAARRHRNHHHYPRLMRAGTMAPIELHRSLGPRGRAASGPVFLLDPTDKDPAMPELAALCDALPLPARGLTVAGLSPEHRICHAILHSELQDRHHALGVIALKELLDLAAVRERYGATIDWSVIRAIFQANQREAVLDSFLLLAERCLDLKQPKGSGNDRAARLHAWRCRAQMSFRPVATATALWALADARLSDRAMHHRYGAAENETILASQRMRYLRELMSVQQGGPLKRLRTQYRKAVSETLKYGPEAL